MAQADLREPCEVAVVGAGVVGLSVALHLVRSGFELVTVVERTGVAAGASGVQPGGVRQQWGTRVNCLLARESVRFYLDLHAQLRSRVAPRLAQCGYMFLAHSPARLERLAADVATQNEAGVPSVILSSAEAVDRVPDLSIETVVGASWCDEDGYFDRPQAVVAAFAEAAEREGATITRADVRALTRARGQWELELADGFSLRAEHVILATGYETPALLNPLDIRLPIRKEPRYLFLSDPIRERLLEPLVASSERSFAAKHLADGRVLASDTAADGDGDTAIEGWRRSVRESIEVLLPRLQYVSFPILVEGFYDSTPDHQPIIDQLDERLWVAAGFSGHGFMLAPAIGRRVAACLAGSPVDDLLESFAAHRSLNTAGLSEAESVV